MTKTPVMLAALLALACNAGGAHDDASDTEAGGNPLAGLYKVTSDAAAETCGDYVENVVPIPFLDVVEVDGVLEVRKCRSRDDCDTFADEDFAFAADGEAYKTVRTWTYYNDADGGICSNQARRTTLREPADGRIALESAEVTETLSATDVSDDSGCEARLGDWSPSFTSGTYDCWKLVAERADVE